MPKLVILFFCLLMVSPARAQTDLPFETEVITSFDEPWAMAFLPDGRMLVTEKKGAMFVVTADGEKQGVFWPPEVAYGNQGGLGDVILHPDFATNNLIYLSYAEPGVGGTRGAAVARAVLEFDDRGRGRLSNTEVIWRQYPKHLDRGHYSHRLLFDDDGYLWISSGDRRMFTPSQDMQSNLGKILRLHEDGSVPADNPFVDYRNENAFVRSGGVYGQIWSLGHRNPLGMAFDLEGHLWVADHGPAGGDELNRIVRKGNYGYPIVSNGEHYDGRPIPDHDTRPEFEAPYITWTPAIAPGNMIVYRGTLFPGWLGNALVSGLKSQDIVRIELGEDSARVIDRYPMGARIRSVIEGPDGALWVLEDERGDSAGRLLKLTPADRL